MKKSISVALFLGFSLIVGIFVPSVLSLAAVPEQIYIADGAQSLSFNLPFSGNVSADNPEIALVNGARLENEGEISLSNPVTISPSSDGSTELTFSVFGFSLKNVKVTVGKTRSLIPGGQSIGVLLMTNGALVVGAGDILGSDGQKINPAKDADLRPGDIIEKVNGQPISSADELSKIVGGSDGADIELYIKRNNGFKTVKITPAKDFADGKLKLGVWVRDSTAGVGTLSFIDPETKRFAGLGHAISDSDTGSMLSVKDGDIVQSEIMQVVKGAAGVPGEIKGYFDPNRDVLGKIVKNSPFGIFGNVSESVDSDKALPVASRSEVVEGEAKLLCTIDDMGIQEFSCKISKINTQNQPTTKSFVVEITDPVLLKKTGGIIQGMSGSPLIQNGKIIGAVTHVFVNDPRRGYGVYIEWMLNELNW